MIEKIWEAGIRYLELFRDSVPEITNTLAKDYTKTQDEALLDLFRRLRPGDPMTLDSAKNLIEKMFFDNRRYDLTKVGRYMLNRKLGMKLPLNKTILDNDTIINVLKYLLELKNGEGTVDDIDHLGNRRVRTVGSSLKTTTVSVSSEWRGRLKRG